MSTCGRILRAENGRFMITKSYWPFSVGRQAAAGLLNTYPVACSDQHAGRGQLHGLAGNGNAVSGCMERRGRVV